MAASSKSSFFHPACAVTNIKTAIPIVLDTVKGDYNNWSALFRNTCVANQVLSHIDPSAVAPAAPPTAVAPAADPPAETDAPAADPADALIPAPRPGSPLWIRLDAIVLQWIYATISPDLLSTIIKHGSTAQAAWDHLARLFTDNKHSRAAYLENQFSSTRFQNFSNAAAYCNALKTLADRLANVDAPVSDQRLVLRLVAGLPDSFGTLATIIQQLDPLPSFEKASSMLQLEETRSKEKL